MNDVRPIAEIMAALLEKISLEKNSSEQYRNANTASAAWKKILLSINGNGETLYYNSKIIDKKNGTLMIEVDHPAVIQLFQFSENYILKGLKKFAPELDVTNFSYRLKKG
jgi:hypothetical protein